MFFHRAEILLIMFGITYVIFDWFNNDISISAIYTFIVLPFIIFKIGRLSIDILKSEKNIILYVSISIIALSFLFVYSALSTFPNDVISSTRILEIKYYSMTNNSSELSATLVGLHIAPVMAFLPTFLFYRNINFRTYFVLGSLFTIMALITTSIVATRSPVIIFALLLLLNFYYGTKSVSLVKKSLIIFLFLSFIIIISAIDFSNFDLTKLLYERMTSEDISEAGSRTNRWFEGIKNIFLYPFGGEKTRIGHYHNMWLDLRYTAGVVPMIILISISIYFTYAIWKVINSNKFSIQFKSFIGSIYLSIFLMMFMEPVIQGSIVFFLYYLFFGGIIVALKNINPLLFLQSN